MQVNMSIVGQPNVTITCFNEEVETLNIESDLAKMGENDNKNKKRSSAHFDKAKKRLFADGAEGVKLFPVE